MTGKELRNFLGAIPDGARVTLHGCDFEIKSVSVTDDAPDGITANIEI